MEEELLRKNWSRAFLGQAELDQHSALQAKKYRHFPAYSGLAAHQTLSKRVSVPYNTNTIHTTALMVNVKHEHAEVVGLLLVSLYSMSSFEKAKETIDRY